MRRLIRIIRGLAIVLVALAVIVGAPLGWAVYEFSRPGPLSTQTTIIFSRGAGSTEISHQLADAGVIREPLLFEVAAGLAPYVAPTQTHKPGEPHRSLQAGEYQFAAGETLRGVLEQMRTGKTVVRRLTAPEGLTSAEILDLLARTEALDGPPPAEFPPDGSLLPETYFYAWGDKRADMIARMRRAMTETVAAVWAKRVPNDFVTTPAEAVILASLVERETAVPAERAHIAGVFINRLRLGMRLQSDPTVIYALTGGHMNLGRPLAHDDLAVPSPYNTYLSKGLPPAPIANPGRAALEAVAKPMATQDLYFVADGTGGHAFAATLEDHNKNVAKYRQLQSRGEPADKPKP